MWGCFSDLVDDLFPSLSYILSQKACIIQAINWLILTLEEVFLHANICGIDLVMSCLTLFAILVDNSRDALVRSRLLLRIFCQFHICLSSPVSALTMFTIIVLIALARLNHRLCKVCIVLTLFLPVVVLCCSLLDLNLTIFLGQFHLSESHRLRFLLENWMLLRYHLAGLE